MKKMTRNEFLNGDMYSVVDGATLAFSVTK